MTRIAIIGGGISGLSAALRVHELATEQGRDVRITLLEASDRLGGVLRTERIGEYLVEHAADMWITNKPEATRLCEKLGLAERLIPTNAQFRKSLVLRDGKVHPVPEGFQLMVPEQAWPMLRSPLLSWRGKLRLLAEAFVRSRRDGADESLSDFVRRRCGHEVFERLVQPLVGGIYTANPEKLSLKATLPRFIEMERQHGSLIRAALRQSRDRSRGEASGTSGARYGLFVSLPNGIEELVSALSRRVAEFAEIRYGAPVRRVVWTPTSDRSDEGGQATFTLDADVTQHFDAVILAVPSFVAANVLADGCPTLSAELNRIEYASTVVVASGHKLADIEHPLDAFGLVIPHIERRKLLAVSFTSRKFSGRAPDGRVLLRTFIGGALQPELCHLDDAAILDLVRRELRELLGVRGEPDFLNIFRHTRAMPQYHVGHLDLVARIQAATKQSPGLVLAGNFLTGVGIPDSIASGESAAEKVMKG
ncbi:protoporphyrinogen oxidase [Planctomycetia bacterium]|nr:protoporphyrinogen oxidase [Planctomycetia bacterium]